MKTIAAALAAAFLAAGCASSLGGTLGVRGRTLDGAEGVEVVRLVDGSPLEAKGVKRGDIIVSLGGEPVASDRDLQARIRAAGFENAVRLGVRQGDSLREIDVVPAEARRTFKIGFMIPFVGGWDGENDTATLGQASLLKVGVGPDQKGLWLASCVGWWSRPEGWDVSLVVLTTGSSFRIEPPSKEVATSSP
jgi:membrane-associated protease RseP (regulator of RpoE activity)